MYPEFKTWTISFEDRVLFNKVSSWDNMDNKGVVDIGYSDMILIFDKKSKWCDFEGLILDSGINYSDYILGNN